jgi:hypothetical protein
MKFHDQTYLRAEHLLKHGKYIAAKVTIENIVEDCPIKRGDKDAFTIGLAFAKSDKILGLNKTNYSLICWELGEGKPQDWIGKQITLVVRLVRNKKLNEPAIRVWPTLPHARAQVREQMGTEITDEWYSKNMPQETKVGE